MRNYGSTPTFWTKGYRTFTFQDENMKNFLWPAVNRGDLWNLNYNKTVFGLRPCWRAHDALPGPRVRWGDGTSYPFSSSISPRNPLALRSPSNWYRHYLDQTLIMYRHNTVSLSVVILVRDTVALSTSNLSCLSDRPTSWQFRTIVMKRLDIPWDIPWL